MSTRAWERWDDAGVADAIEAFWRGSRHENAHRDTLADVCALYIPAPHTSVVEVGCGTGLIYERLVPRLLSNEHYTGVDVSEKMLEIARRRFPQGRFVSGDGYRLGFDDDAFELALAFEVLGHLPDVGVFVRELVRVGRQAVFTVWPCAEGVVDGEEEIRGSRFLHRMYSHAYLCGEIARALPGVALDLEVAVLAPECWAYVLTRRDGPGGLALRHPLPLSDHRDRLLREIAAARLPTGPARAHDMLLN